MRPGSIRRNADQVFRSAVNARVIPLHAATGQWPDHWQYVCIDRHRLHDGLRHHRNDQLRPRRGVHDRFLCCFHGTRRTGDAGDSQPAVADDCRFCRSHHRDQRLWIQHRARGLPSVAQQQPSDSTDFCDRHVDLPAELGSAFPGFRQLCHPQPAARQPVVRARWFAGSADFLHADRGVRRHPAGHDRPDPVHLPLTHGPRLPRLRRRHEDGQSAGDQHQQHHCPDLCGRCGTGGRRGHAAEHAIRRDQPQCRIPRRAQSIHCGGAGRYRLDPRRCTRRPGTGCRRSLRRRHFW